jgi:hypothetical protein
MFGLKLGALVLKFGEFVRSLLEHALQQLDLGGGCLRLDFVGITRSFFF